jgi:hypothetical protein
MSDLELMIAQMTLWVASNSGAKKGPGRPKWRGQVTHPSNAHRDGATALGAPFLYRLWICSPRESAITFLALLR